MRRDSRTGRPEQGAEPGPYEDDGVVQPPAMSLNVFNQAEPFILSVEEGRRAHALDKALELYGTRSNMAIDTIVATATKFETYLKGDNDDEK